MKKNTFLLVYVAFLWMFFAGLLTPVEKVGCEAISVAIDLLQPDESFQIGQVVSQKEKHHDLV